MLRANDLLAFVLAVVLVTLLWALFFSPKANYPLKGTLRWVLEGLILALPLLQFYSKNKLLMVVSRGSFKELGQTTVFSAWSLCS